MGNFHSNRIDRTHVSGRLAATGIVSFSQTRESSLMQVIPATKGMTGNIETEIRTPKIVEDVMADKEKKANQTQNRPITVDDSKAVSCYANFCRVTGSPEELIIDFGLNSQPMGSSDKPVDINQRIVLNFYTAKRLLHALHVSVQRHEQVFGQIETDIQKRVVAQETAAETD